MSRRGEPTPAAGGPDAVADLVERMASRLRRFGTRQWREPVPPSGATAGDVVHELVLACARREAELRGLSPGERDVVPGRPRYDAALADQLAVVGRDLADALADAGDAAAAARVTEELTAYADRLRLAVGTAS